MTIHVPVDKKIIPVVNWLNAYEAITTRWCCQGDANEKPYITFLCESVLTLSQVLLITRYFATTEVEFYEPQGAIRYTMRFNDEKSLTEFVKTRKNV